MKKIIYYVAASLDGYISGINDDVSAFIYEGEGPEKYLEDLKLFSHVLMGRKTYEFGYQFGVTPGDPSPTYSHMRQYIISNHLQFEKQDKQVIVLPVKKEAISTLKREADTDIYLCGGGLLAGWLLKNELIDELRIKLNPVILAQGVKLFEGVKKAYKLKLTDKKQYNEGLIILKYEILYGNK